MADFGGMVLTTRGLNLLAKAQTGAELVINRVAAGAGVWAAGTNAEAVTALADERLTVPIQSMTVPGDGTVKLTVVISNSGLVAGFIFRELGVFAHDPDLGEILYAVAYAGERYDFLPAAATVVEKILDIYIVVGGAQNVTATISPGAVIALKDDIDAHAEADPAHPSTKIGFSNTIALLAGAPTRAQTAIEALANEVTDVEDGLAAHEVADPAHPASKISFANIIAQLDGNPARVQTALEALAAGSMVWSALQTYRSMVIKFGLDGKLYVWLAPSGPDIDGVGAHEPGTAGGAAYWAQLRITQMLQSELVFYVSTTGSNTNDGLSEAKAFRSIDYAISVVASRYSLGDHNVLIMVKAGEYNEQVVLRPYASGSGAVYIIGAGIGQTILKNTAASPGVMAKTVTSAPDSGSYIFRSLTILIPNVASLGCCGISVSNSTVEIENVSIVASGSSIDNAIVVDGSGTVYIRAGCSISAYGVFLYASLGGVIGILNNLTMNGTATTATVIAYSGSSIWRASATLPVISGAVTGKRYMVSLNSVIETVGGGANYFPGTVAGTAATGGQYV